MFMPDWASASKFSTYNYLNRPWSANICKRAWEGNANWGEMGTMLLIFYGRPLQSTTGKIKIWVI